MQFLMQGGGCLICLPGVVPRVAFRRALLVVSVVPQCHSFPLAIISAWAAGCCSSLTWRPAYAAVGCSRRWRPSGGLGGVKEGCGEPRRNRSGGGKGAPVVPPHEPEARSVLTLTLILLLAAPPSEGTVTARAVTALCDCGVCTCGVMVRRAVVGCAMQEASNRKASGGPPPARDVPDSWSG
jgi:hypothetical protein